MRKDHQNMADDKIYITATDLLRDSFQLGHIILESGFIPDYIVAIWRGGTPIGIAVQELYDYAGIKTDHIAIRTSYYTGLDRTAANVQVHGLGYLVDNVENRHRILIVDDIFDSGNSIAAMISELKARAKRNTPHEIRIATPWYKPSRNVTDFEPDYFIHETDRWVVFPHELQGLTSEEVKKGKQEVADLIEKINKLTEVKSQMKEGT